MKLRRIKFGLLILLVFSLQVRFAIAAQNWCPWMQAPMDLPSQQMQTDPVAMPDCEGMSAAGICHLQPICAAVPLLAAMTLPAQQHALPTHWATKPRMAFTSEFASPPEHIPIS
jgi:hypothetical protein